MVTITIRSSGEEEFLSPTLGIVAERGPIPVDEIMKQLAQEGLLNLEASTTWPAAHRGVPSLLSETGQAVVRATIALRESGLLASEGPGIWRITRAGRRLHSKGEQVSFETLKRRPPYKEYLRKLKAEAGRRDWQALRFDSYVSGRLLTFDGSSHTAPSALAYALEYSLKAALAELRGGLVPAATLRCHDFPKLYHTCLDHDLLTQTYVSDDFLEYAQHHFERRYPSGQARVLQERKYWTFGREDLTTYDDCLLQIDRGLDEIYASSEWSLGNRALTIHGRNRLSRAFFHDNVYAIARLPEYRRSVDDGRLCFPEPERLERRELLFCSGDDLPCPRINYQRAQELLTLDLAALFIYPQVSGPHADPARVLLTPRGAHLGDRHNVEWILRQLREEFGSSSVEFLQDSRTQEVSIVVYDRGSKLYWASLPLSQEHLPSLARNIYTRELLDRWIDGTKKQFASERRVLRLPDPLKKSQPNG
ncbi:MAG: hypothetical protein K8J08_11135 [Thermoanaerobaculia bacterium]|nr:hypothetical protein [Thermoanaerobaculia bacterium]